MTSPQISINEIIETETNKESSNNLSESNYTKREETSSNQALNSNFCLWDSGDLRVDHKSKFNKSVTCSLTCSTHLFLFPIIFRKLPNPIQIL